MGTHYSSLVAGLADSGNTKTVVSPYDGALIGTVSTVDEAGAMHALDTAYSIYRDRSRWLSAPQRIEILEKTAQIMRQRFDELALEAAREGGKPLNDSVVEVDRAIDGVRNCIECIRSESGKEIPMGINAASMGHLAFTRKEPIGVVVAVSAFNHPLNLIVHQSCPALAAGCPFIIKPAGATPISCLRFIAILHEAGLPPAYGQALLTDTSDTATALVSDQRVGFFSFIGSARVGWMLRSKLAPGARCALEHGGVAPVIVEADADLDTAAPALAKGGFYHAGQVCVSVQRVFAHSSIAEYLATRLANLGTAMTIGDPTLAETEIGPIINEKEVTRIDAWVQEAIQAGATLISGGERLDNNCYAATVLLNPPADVTISQKEVFGPVICVYSYDDIDAAIAQANSLMVSFQAAVFTKNIDRALYAYTHLDAAAVMVNNHTAFRVDWMPFAGLKHSGHGVGGIPYTFEEMQVSKLAVIRSPAL
ncbi:MAG: aldehyde dehydrogenase family protein [Cellvibrionaceae bacterium]|nr:aldehyde dehydrogenase family protein [Cellvibrionaceae bacterium]